MYTLEKIQHGTWTSPFCKKGNNLPNLHFLGSKCYFSGMYSCFLFARIFIRASFGLPHQDIFKHPRWGCKKNEPLHHALCLSFQQPNHRRGDDQLGLREHRICRRVDVVHTFHLKDVAQGINQTNVSKSLHIAHLKLSCGQLWMYKNMKKWWQKNLKAHHPA